MGVQGSHADAFCDALLGFGAQAAWVEEAVPEGGQEEPIYADPVQGRGRQWIKAIWQNCRVVALFEASDEQAAMEAVVEKSAQAAGVSSGLELAWSEVLSEDWEEQIKASYVPVQLTDDLWIIPEWCEPPEPEKVNLLLKPGLAFGTGDHPTTRLCLQWLAKADLTGTTLLDYGAGSGILSIGALLFGASHVVAVDVDPLSVRATLLNAELNGVAERCEAYVCEPFSTDPEPLAAAGASVCGGFDVCVANILKPAVLDLRPRLTAYLRSGGVVVLSGMLEHQAQDVKDAYAADFDGLEVLTLGEWALVTGVKR